MRGKGIDISPDLVIHPGETIADLLQERGITQKELALRTGESESFLSDVIQGKKDISKSLASSLQVIFDVPESFWLNLQANYDAEVLTMKKKKWLVEQLTNARKKAEAGHVMDAHQASDNIREKNGL